MRDDLADTDEARREQFIREATWHGSLDRAEAMLAAHPQLASADIHVAAILGDHVAVRRFIERDPASMQAKSAPYGGDALNYLGLSKYLRLDSARTPAFVLAATVLLDAGADPNTGFWTTGEFPEHETALYGAAGVAHNPDVTRLLLERGADPNDGEVVYHAPETTDNRVIELLVATGRLTKQSLSIMLIRKLDWHDSKGLKFLLGHGAPAEARNFFGWNALHHALARGNRLEAIGLLLDHGADPRGKSDGIDAIARAARFGRKEVLAEFARRGVAINLAGVDRLIAVCANGDAAAAHALALEAPALRRDLLQMGGPLLARFAIRGNIEGVRILLDLGVSATAPFAEQDVYFGFTPETLPIHAAAKVGYPEIVKLLIERGSPTDAKVDELLALKEKWWL